MGRIEPKGRFSIVSSLRFAVIGTGAIARAYEAAFASMRGAEIVAVCDVDLSAAQAYAQRIGCPSYSSVRSLLDRSRIDAAVVCTPPATHEAVACELLQAGVHVLCEKPLAVNASQARRMLGVASANGVILTMASKFRFASDVRKAREIVMEGEIGDLVFVENAFTAFVDMSERWNSNAAVSGGGVLIDNGTHAVDILRYFLGNLRDVQIVEGRRMQGLSVEDTVRLFVHNDQDVIGSSDLSWSIDKELETFVRLYGSEGTVLVGWKESKFRRRGESDWRTFGNGYDKIQAFRDQLLNFCEAIQGRANLVVSPVDALASVEVIQAAYAALEYARWERIGSHLDDIAVVPLRRAQAS
jgi:predicted dehydrogenase